MKRLAIHEKKLTSLQFSTRILFSTANQEAHVADSSKNGSTLCAVTHFPTIVSKCQMQLIFLFHSHHTSKLQTEKKCERLGVNLNAANQALFDTGTDTESFDKTSEEESYYSSVASSPSTAARVLAVCVASVSLRSIFPDLIFMWRLGFMQSH